MNQLSSITPLEIILIGSAAVGVFLFFRACWRNIKRSRQHLSLALLTLMMPLTAMAQQSMTSSATSWSGEYTVTGNVTIDSEVRLTGDATVNLAEGATLNINGRIDCSDGTKHALTINGSGTMNVTGSYDGSGIIRFFSKATINGGTVNVTNSSDFYGYAFYSNGENNCIVVLNGGTVHTIVPKQNSDHFFGTNFTLAGGTLWPEGGILICNMKSTIADGYVYEDKATEKLYAGTLTSNEKKEILGHEFARNPDAYTVKVVDVEGVTVTADCRAAKEGQTINVTAKPTVAGYFIGAKYNDGTDHELELDSDGKCSFEMRETNVTISGTKTAAFVEGDGTKDNPFLIKDKNDWSDFRKLINSNLTYEVNKDKCFKLDDDISVTSRIGANSTYVFMGTFDGGDHTLNVAYNNAPIDYLAPIRFVSGATIQNLHVSGTMTAEKKYAAGIIGKVMKGSTTTIKNCTSSVTIQSNVEGDGTHGGLVAKVNDGAKLTINGCVFDGKIVSTGASATTDCGGFVGYNSGKLTILKSLYAPQTDANAVSTGATFARNGGTITNCYYTQTLGTAQGKQAYEVSSAPDLLGSSTGDGIVKTYGTYGLGFDNKYYLGTIPLSETEGVSYLTDNLQGETVPVVFKRTFKAGQPSTLCLPFSFVPDQTIQGKVYEFGGVNDQWRVQMNNIQMSDATAATVANQPYGFIPVIPDGKKKGDEVVVLFSGTVNVANAAADHTQVGNWDMHGTYERVDWSSGYWYGYNAANGVFSHCVSGAYFPTFRCYLVFTPPSATRGNSSLGTTLPGQMGVDFNDSANALATGVSSITVQTAEDAWYTLDGRKLDAEPTKKGIYIYKGKKVIK